MHAPAGRIFTVQSITIARLLLGIVFAVLAFQIPLALSAGIYGLAAATDLIDGAVARRLDAKSELGSVLDLISDKSLTIISVLYAAVRGIDLGPLAVIAARDIILLGLRIVTVGGRPLLKTSRAFGGLAAASLWGTTFSLILTHSTTVVRGLNFAYWLICAVLTANLIIRLYQARKNLIRALIGE